MNSTDTYLTQELMKATLLSNLATLKNYIPKIYDFYQSYERVGNEIVIDDNGKPNLYNNGKFVYEDALEFGKFQVDQFCSKATSKNYISFEIAPQKDSEINFEHEHLLKKLTVQRRKDTFYETPNNPWEEEQVDFMFMIGSGLGYQIEEIFKRKDVCNFFLFEPSPEVFFAMLHCIDLKPLIEHCFSRAGQFKITIGFGPETAMNNLNVFLIEIGHFNIVRMFVFKHYESETADKMIKLFNSIGHRLSLGFGFMEDEIISFSHTLSNIKSGYPMLLKQNFFNNPEPNRPILIAANGPSLDELIHNIKDREAEFIIISCGTSLRPLLANGITPDIHVEMERTETTLPWIDSIPNQEQLKNIQIIALAPVCTEVLSKFKAPKIVNKLYDSIGYIVQATDLLGLFEFPDKMNPTVTNCALTLMISLGFKNIYLIGTDLGFKSLEHHHSKDSMYYDEDKYKAEEALAMFTKELKLAGNFGGEVFSTKIFEQSKGNIELLLDNNQDVSVSNCSDGVAIKGASPLSFELISPYSADIGKHEFLAGFLSNAFSLEQIDYSVIEKSSLETFQGIKSCIDKLFAITDKKIQSRGELRLLFALQYQTLLHEVTKSQNTQGTKSSISLFLQGSLKYFQAVIMSNSYHYNNLSKRNNYINDSIAIMKAHFYTTYQELIEQYNMPSKV
jgi:hypothetical protein